jgi:uncharacterized protein (DUF1015 family)
MAEVEPFAGLRFGGAPLADVIAPPYDVISPDEQDRLYARSPFNVVRLELGREKDRYAEARRCLHDWRQQGVLRQDEPSFYVYEQRFYSSTVRRGLFGRVKLEPWSAGVVLPHEETLTKPKADRLDLLRAVQANVSPVFALYEDPAKELAATLAGVCRGEPTAEATDDAGEQHRLWQVSDPAVTSRVSSFFGGKRLFIADGHHRYETALAYRNENPGVPAADFAMMTFVNMHSPGLRILATHRVLRNLDDFQAPALLAKARAAGWSVREGMPGHGAPGSVRIGLIAGSRAYTLERERREGELDVPVLHAEILGGFLGIGEEAVRDERYITYVRGTDAAVAEVREKSAQAAFLLEPTPIEDMARIAFAGGVMPQKSTDFYPKLLSGVTIYRL